jgi:urease accessory protein
MRQMTRLARTRLLQLASQALPIGVYSHSQGLESAVESGLVHDEASTHGLADVLHFSFGCYELPVLQALCGAWQRRDAAGLGRLNEEFLATRESAELRAATVQMGFSMRALVQALPDPDEWLCRVLHALGEPGLPCVWSGLATAWSIPAVDACMAYAWNWAENQVLAAMKTVPIGQSAGQRILLQIGSEIAAWEEGSAAPVSTNWSNFAPGLAILSSQHETQYSRLFRS